MNKLEKITIKATRHDLIGFKEWWMKVQEAFEDGYRFKDHNLLVSEIPTFNPMPRITLYHLDYINSDIEIEKLDNGLPVDWEERLKACRKTNQVKAFAERYGIDLIEENNVNKYKAYVKEEISKL